MKNLVLYNPLSQQEHGLENAKQIEKLLPPGEFEYQSILEIPEPTDFIRSTPKDTKIIATGGDGTLFHLANALIKAKSNRELFFFPAGTGNDFMNDLDKNDGKTVIRLNDYIQDLPYVRINGGELGAYFINGVSLGVDGYACVERSRLKEKGITRSYTAIAAGGLFGKYKAQNIRLTVDDETFEYHKCFMVPTMWGRFYGGHVEMAPNQVRGNREGTVTSVISHDTSRVRAMSIFPAAIKGKGPELKKYIDYRNANYVKVECDSPSDVQIDGEPYSNVLKYEVFSGEAKKKIGKDYVLA